MAGICGKDTKPKRTLQRAMHALGTRYRPHGKGRLASLILYWRIGRVGRFADRVNLTITRSSIPENASERWFRLKVCSRQGAAINAPVGINVQRARVPWGRRSGLDVFCWHPIESVKRKTRGQITWISKPTRRLLWMPHSRFGSTPSTSQCRRSRCTCQEVDHLQTLRWQT